MVSRVHDQRGTQKLSLNNSEQQHDPYFIHEVRQSIADYFSSISYRVESMHKFTDGCAAQYNIDIALRISDFGYKNFTRIIFEAALAKNNIFLRVQLSHVSYVQFLMEHDL